jgi:hypothetical protein
MHKSRSSGILATPWFFTVIFMRVVAIVSKPGTPAISRLGIFHSMPWNHLGPKGIFMGIAGLPSGLICGLRSFFSKARP